MRKFLRILPVLFLFSPFVSFAAVSLLDSTPVSTYADTDGDTSGSYTVPMGAEISVAVVHHNSGTIAATLNGDTMTCVEMSLEAGADPWAYCYVLTPSTGTLAVSGASGNISVTIASFDGVDTGSPIGASYGYYASAVSPFQYSIASNSGDMVVFQATLNSQGGTTLTGGGSFSPYTDAFDYDNLRARGFYAPADPSATLADVAFSPTAGNEQMGIVVVQSVAAPPPPPPPPCSSGLSCYLPSAAVALAAGTTDATSAFGFFWPVAGLILGMILGVLVVNLIIRHASRAARRVVGKGRRG